MMDVTTVGIDLVTLAKSHTWDDDFAAVFTGQKVSTQHLGRCTSLCSSHPIIHRGALLNLGSEQFCVFLMSLVPKS
jgi:hypothetical protein